MSVHWWRPVGASASTFKAVPQLGMAVPWRIGIVRRYGSVVMGDVSSEVSERS
jgi:hypothetical protein